MIDFLVIFGAILGSIFVTAMIFMFLVLALLMWNDEWKKFKLNKFKLTEWEEMVAERRAKEKFEEMQEEKFKNRKKRKIR